MRANPTLDWTKTRGMIAEELRRARESAVAEFTQDPAPSQEHGGPELSIIVPTFNERENVGALVERFKDCLSDRAFWEVVFVDDDSPDGTAELIRELASKDVRVRCIRRIGRRGLASACIEGMLASSAQYLAVIDADLQHDEKLLPKMLDMLKVGEADIVVGSRYAPGGGIGSWDAGRARLSRVATRLGRLLVPETLTDPMSGFFMLRRSVFNGAVPKLSAIGSKILMDIIASSAQPLRFKELSYTFMPRQAGESKLDSVTAWDYAMLLIDKLIGHLIPVRFLAFSIVGALGVIVHFAVLTVLFRLMQCSFIAAQAIATVCAMTFNFSLNNVLTYRDEQLRGVRWLRGWLSFNLACSVGGLMNLAVASFVYTWIGAWYAAAAAGIFVGAVWNYAVTKILTWGRSRK